MVRSAVGADSLREGERVVTSGDGGLYPRGLPVGVARRGRDGQWRVALSVGTRPIDFVRLIPFVGVENPEAEPADGGGPPLNTQSSVASVGRDVTPPPPGAPVTNAPPPRPQRAPTAPQPAAQAPVVPPPTQTPPPDPEPQPPGPTE